MLKILITLMLTSASAMAFGGWHEREAQVMGTEARVYFWHTDEKLSDKILDDAFAELRRIDTLMSTYKETSELSLVNREAFKAPVVVSSELVNLVTQALAVSRRSQGAFDITYASVGYLYDFPNQVRPAETIVEQRLDAVDFRHVIVNREKNSIQFSHPDVRIDLGGIAKGYAVDKVIAELKKHQIQHAMVSAGGDTRVVGRHFDRPWVVGIQDPRSSEDVVALIPLLDEAISTSGDYERFFDENGMRYHHIIDPQTGDSARAVRSVSILGPESTMADALSTSLFVLGLKKGVALIDSIEAYEAILVDQKGLLHYSTGLQQYIESDSGNQQSNQGL